MRQQIIGGSVLYQGDCFDIIPSLGKVDAIILDPPYELSSSGPGKSHFGMSLNKFDSPDYKKIVDGFDLEIFDLLEKTCLPFNMFCFCSNKQISKIMSYHESKGRIVTLLVWHKTNAAPFANGVWRGDIEYCVHARDAGSVFRGNAQEKCKVFPHPIVVGGVHPTMKPLDLIEKYVKICSFENQIILDPFGGLFTTGVACARLGRKFIGIEKDERWFELGCKRLEEALSQPDFFLSSPNAPTQQKLF